MGRSRNQRGSITALSAALAGVLVVLGVGFFFFIMYMDAQKETKNAVDAGTLNTGRKALDDVAVKVLPTSCFYDITSDKTDNKFLGCDGDINLRRVNRMWAEAMLIKINAMANEAKGTGGSGSNSAQSALSEAKNLSDQLSDKLNDESNLHPFFKDLAQQNSVRMIGNGASVKVIPGSGWKTSKMLPEQESNIILGGTPGNNFFAPPGFAWNSHSDYITKTTRNPKPQGSDNLIFLKGYKALSLDGDDYWQVPFLYDEKPHMVSKTDFDKAKNNSAGWSKPVPNAFSAEGEASAPGKPAEKAISWTLTNPRQPFKMAIPHSFIHIKVETPKAKFLFYPVGFPVEVKQTDYGFGPPQLESATMPGGGPGCSNVAANNIPIGIDTTFRSIDELIFDYPVGNKTELENQLTARCNEMISQVGGTITVAEMHSALAAPANRAALVAGQRDFYVYSPDGKNIHCNILPIAIGETQWLAAHSNKNPDGSEVTSIDADGFAPWALPSIVTPLPFFTPLPFPISITFGRFFKEVMWKPGTGYNHCLGEVRVKRSTEVSIIGVSVFP